MSHDPRNVNLTPMPMPPQPPSEWDGPCANPSCACMRHETRVERAIRRQAGEEIAQAIEAHDLADSIWHGQHIRQCAAIAREIANRETS